MTLWSLLVYNNWHEVMNAYAIVFGEEARVFFMVYYLVIMIVLTVVVAFLFEAFLFRMQITLASSPTNGGDSANNGNNSAIRQRNQRREEIRVHAPELAVKYLCDRPNQKITEDDLAVAAAVSAQLDSSTNTTIEFVGTRKKTRFDYNREFYEADITVSHVLHRSGSQLIAEMDQQRRKRTTTHVILWAFGMILRVHNAKTTMLLFVQSK